MQVPSKAHTSLDDPRPNKRRNMVGYNDFVRSQTINFSNEEGKLLACRFLWPQADIRAAMKDHDYLNLPFVEHWVDYSNKV